MMPTKCVGTSGSRKENVGLSLADLASFQSILFPFETIPDEIDRQVEPACFRDLNLDQVVQVVITGREEYKLRAFFYCPPRDVRAIRYRHDIFCDLERRELKASVQDFASAMQLLRRLMARVDSIYYERQRQRCLLEAVHTYTDGIRQFATDLGKGDPKAAGMQALLRHVNGYINSRQFREMENAAQHLIDELGEIRYALHIHGKRVTVRRYDPEPDYSADVLETFEKFRQGASKEYRFKSRPPAEMNHVEAAILDRVALLYPELFASLAEFCSRYRSFMDPVLIRFDREVQFYLAWLEHVDRFKELSLAFCYPAVSDVSEDIHAEDGFDLALAEARREEGQSVVTNGFSISGEERVLVVTGPNQGGKTTFARMFGQLHFLAALGCPVPAKAARLFLFDQLFTHFERSEAVENLRGKLEDELLRIRQILESATSDSILIMNESFLSTTLDDALFLSRKTMEKIVERDMLCLSVTFLDEMSRVKSAVSMVGEVDSEDPSRRTFRIRRRPADGLAYAMTIAKKYALTRDGIQTRIARNAEGAGE